MPLTGEPSHDISHMMDKVKRTGRFGNMPRGMSKKRLHRAAIAAALSAKRRKKAKGRKSKRSQRGGSR